jgi:GT2 family glycosyltransferase
MTVPDLSICIVNHRTPTLLQQCLQSIVETALDVQTETWVVNNTLDGDGRIKRLIQRFPNVVWMQNETPLGFSANQNKMLQKAKGSYLMPLNADTVVKPGALRELVNFMDAHPRVGIAGPKLVHTDGLLQPSCRNFPTPVTHFMEASGLWQLFRNNRAIGRWYYLCSPHTQTCVVDWLTGACLIVRAEAARQIGYFNVELFPSLYGEDIDWCWRMRQAGWLVMFDPHAVIVHSENASPLDDRAAQMYRGLYTFCTHYYPPSRQRGIRAATLLALGPRWALARNAQARATYAALMALPMRPAESNL